MTNNENHKNNDIKRDEIIENEDICKQITNLNNETWSDNSLIEKIRNTVESKAELYYFINKPNELYIRNLVKLNPTLIIDDIIYKAIFFLDRKINIENIMEWLYLILKNRYFSRRTLKRIFDTVAYLGFEDSNECIILKYYILAEIIKQYKALDIRIRGNNDIARLKSETFNDETIIKSMELDIIKNLEPYMSIHEQFIEELDISKDNTEVLANIIWENTILIVENYCNIIKSGIMPENEYTFEIKVIIKMYGIIIENTSKMFYYNRIYNKITVFKQLNENDLIDEFLAIIRQNFGQKCKIITEMLQY